MSFGVTLPKSRYATNESRERFSHDIATALRGLPGVEAVSATDFTLTGSPMGFFPLSIDGRPAAASETAIRYRSVSPDYFKTLRIRVVEGREFRDDDWSPVAAKVIVSESFARQHFPGTTAGRSSDSMVAMEKPRGRRRRRRLARASRRRDPAVVLPAEQHGRLRRHQHGRVAARDGRAGDRCWRPREAYWPASTRSWRRMTRPAWKRSSSIPLRRQSCTVSFPLVCARRIDACGDRALRRARLCRRIADS